MSLLTPLATDPNAALARCNPVAKISAAFIITAGLLLTLDPVTPAVLLAVELAAVPATGVRARTLARRTWPLLVGIAGVTLANLIVVNGGETVISLGPIDVTTDAVEAAVSVALRLLAIALPGILVLATTDPMDMADALVQRWRLPARFAYGALAALRLLPLLSADWHQIARARRARGMDSGRSPVAAARLFSSQVFAVLVAAVRRGVRLATAMEARGFDAHATGADGRPVVRTVARPQPMRPSDWLLVVGALVAVVAATAISVTLGAWSVAYG